MNIDMCVHNLNYFLG